ncbi:MAG: TolC family protein, partial [Terracidiphilus sp.]
MHLFGIRVLKQNEVARPAGSQTGRQLRALAAAMLTLSACLPSGFAQQQASDVLGAGQKKPESSASVLPPAPAPTLTQPMDLRQTERDFSKPAARALGSPINWYRPTTIGEASFANSVRLTNLVKDGKIYLSLSDAIALGVENNYDIAIARYDLDIADTDILRAKAGNALLGAPSSVLTGTIGGSPTILTTGGGPGGTSVGSGGAGSGALGLTLTTNGAGPLPELLDPSVTGTIQWDRNRTQLTGPFSPAAATNTNTYNFTYNQGFVPGTLLAVTWGNLRTTSSSPFEAYFPNYTSNFKATVTQNLLQGAGIWVNKRFIYQARNDRRITDSSFRQQILYTVNQVEQIY